MHDIAIRVEGLGKRYHLGKPQEKYKTFRDSVTSAMSLPVRAVRSLGHRNGHSKKSESIWALKDVSFEVKRGDVVGVIGRNGAGKSTLLKILSRITDPTEGMADIHGRVGSLLEVGTGFHPELTGRENTYLNGAILGMGRKEIDGKFDEIVAFAEVEKFIDTAVKHYSSGMYLRLAFAVAAHLETEILLVDEVLAVGDVVFQKKCLGKMGEVASQGRTVLLVSHNMTAISNLCPTTLWVQQGLPITHGATLPIIADYMALGESNHHFDPSTFPDDEVLELHKVSCSQLGDENAALTTDRETQIQLDYSIKRKVHGLRVGYDLITTDGVLLWRSFDDDTNRIEYRAPGFYTSQCTIPSNLLNSGQYIISLSLTIHGSRWISKGSIQAQIRLLNTHGVNSHYADRNRPGVLMPDLEWKIEEAVSH